MRYNYYYLCLYVLFLLGLVTSCSNDIDYTYKGSNYIQISTADDPASCKTKISFYLWVRNACGRF